MNAPQMQIKSFDALYPSRFLKNESLMGRKVTLTITAVFREELDDGQKKAVKAILSFAETDRQLVCCLTNGISLKTMFGPSVPDWIGKRVVLYPTTSRTGKREPCIRVWGSPDIEADIHFEVKLPRNKPFQDTMHATGRKAEQAPAPEPAAAEGA